MSSLHLHPVVHLGYAVRPRVQNQRQSHLRTTALRSCAQTTSLCAGSSAVASNPTATAAPRDSTPATSLDPPHASTRRPLIARPSPLPVVRVEKSGSNTRG